MIKLNKVSKIYNKNKGNELYALNKASLSIDAGDYYLDGKLIKNISERQASKIRNADIGIVMQDYALIEDITAIENTMLPLDFSKKGHKKTKSH